MTLRQGGSDGEEEWKSLQESAALLSTTECTESRFVAVSLSMILGSHCSDGFWRAHTRRCRDDGDWQVRGANGGFNHVFSVEASA